MSEGGREGGREGGMEYGAKGIGRVTDHLTLIDLTQQGL